MNKLDLDKSDAYVNLRSNIFDNLSAIDRRRSYAPSTVAYLHDSISLSKNK